MTGTERISKAINVFQKINWALVVISVIALVAMLLLDSVNIITIRLFSFRATPFQKEAIEELLIIVVFLPLAYVLVGPAHIKTDMFKNMTPKTVRFGMDMVTGIAITVLSVGCFLATGKGTLHAIQFHSVKMGDVQFSLIPFYVCITLSFLLLFIGNILVVMKQIVEQTSQKSVEVRKEEIKSTIGLT